MAWKSSTFKRSTTNGQFLTKGGTPPASDVSKGGRKAVAGKAMVWTTVKGAGPTAPKTTGEVKQASSQAVAKHRDAMTGVLLEAKKIADDRRETLNSIKDPDLKRSAAR